MGKKFSNVSQALSRLRGWIQAGAALLTNLHLPNFLKDGLYQGAGKTVCVPVLNCYSCPAASGACPIGAFQALVGSSKFSFSYYITGFLILLGVLLGRFICGFLCPFGWFQELLHKIPTKKLSTKKLRFPRKEEYAPEGGGHHLSAAFWLFKMKCLQIGLRRTAYRSISRFYA